MCGGVRLSSDVSEIKLVFSVPPHRPDERDRRSNGVKTPAIDALVEMVRNITGKDFAAEGRTLERLGLGGMDGGRSGASSRKGFVRQEMPP
jgi:hypothetical protein